MTPTELAWCAGLIEGEGTFGVKTSDGKGYLYIRDAAGDVREALKATHPDRGGNPVDFRSVQLARDGAT